MRIWYISPYDVGRNIGGCYNEQIALLPSEDFICLTDHDTLFLRPDTKKQIYEIAEKGEHDLYGCLTNRLNGLHQAPFPELFEEGDISSHIEVASSLHELSYGEVEKTDKAIAGMLMLFKKSTWESVGGFKENSIYFDSIFSKQVPNRAIMQGVYIFHLYRWNQRNPKQYTKHLLS